MICKSFSLWSLTLLDLPETLTTHESQEFDLNIAKEHWILKYVPFLND